MKTILVPTDFSANAKNALEYAIRLANHYGAEIHLIHTFNLSSKSGMFVSMQEAMRKSSRHELRELENETFLKLMNGAKVESHLIRDYVPEGVVHYAKKLKADLIVMGTQGASGLKGVFLGTNTARVLRISKTPVIAVPENYKVKMPKKVIIALDRKDDDLKIFEILRDLKEEFKFQAHAFRIDTNTSPAMVGEAVFEWETGGDYPWDNFTTIHHMNVVEGIKDEVDWISADLVCLVHQERGLIGELFKSSISKKITFESEVPVLVLQRPRD